MNFSMEWRQRLAQLIGLPGPEFDNPDAYLNTVREILAREPQQPQQPQQANPNGMLDYVGTDGIEEE